MKKLKKLKGGELKIPRKSKHSWAEKNLQKLSRVKIRRVVETKDKQAIHIHIYRYAETKNINETGKEQYLQMSAREEDVNLSFSATASDLCVVYISSSTKLFD